MALSTTNIILVFVCSPISFLALVLTLFSIIVLSHLDQCHIFIYFKMENVFILIDCIIAVLLPLYKCKNCFQLIDPSTQCTIDLLLFYFLSPVVEMSSLLCGILAALNCLVKFNHKKDFKLNANPKLLALVFFVLSIINFSYILFSVNIGSYSILNDTYIYECVWNEFGNSSASYILTIFSYSISNGVLILVLIAINSSILIKLRKKMKCKALVLKGPTNNYNRRILEKKLTQLILADCFNLIIGRLPFLIYYILSSYSDYVYFSFAFLEGVFSFVTYFSIILKFLLFYGINKRFRSECRIKLDRIKSLIDSSRFT